MKSQLIAAGTLILFALPALAQTSRSSLPIDYEDVMSAYGQPLPPDSTSYGGGVKKIDYDGMTIEISHYGPTVKEVTFKCESSFNELEISSILKPLSSEEDWKQVDDKNWMLVNAKCLAHWDGEGKITVKALD